MRYGVLVGRVLVYLLFLGLAVGVYLHYEEAGECVYWWKLLLLFPVAPTLLVLASESGDDPFDSYA